MNIEQKLPFSPEKPAVFKIHDSEKLRLMAIGLLENQLLKKHKTPIPTLLTVLMGSVSFHMQGEIILLNAFDTFPIPVGEEHEVKGLKAKNIFTLTQEK